MRLLVCGSRDWSDDKIMRIVLRGFAVSYNSITLIEGEAPGADALSRVIGEELEFEIERYPADWTRYGNDAGPIRNQEMLDRGRPSVVVAFKDGYGKERRKNGKLVGGTEDMVTRAEEAGVPTFVISHGST